MSFTEHIYNQNPWFHDAKNITNDVHLAQLNEFRFVWHWDEFLNFSFEDGVYIVTGPRQVGKSTHLKLLIQKYITDRNRKNFFYFNCDLLDSKQDVVTLVEEYLKTITESGQRTYILLDEITAVKDGILGVKYLLDSGRKRNITYIITGSSSVNLRKTGEYLPGRKGKGKDFHLLPLTFREYVSLVHPEVSGTIPSSVKEKDLPALHYALNQSMSLTKAFDDFLHCGGIPRVINEFHERNTIGADVFETYRAWIRSEIAKQEKQERYVKVILERVVRSLGSDLSYNAIAQDAGIGSHNTIYDYLAFLEDSFIIHQLYHYDISQRRVNVRKNKKLYFGDVFLYWLAEAWIGGKTTQDFVAFKDDVLKSRIVENTVAGELIRRYHDEIFYSKPNEEIDFVSRHAAWEVKYQNRIAQRDIQHLRSFPGRRFVLSKNTLDIGTECITLPVALFLLVMESLDKAL